MESDKSTSFIFRWTYYDELPEGFKIAIMDDFYDDENKLIVGKAFKVQSYKYPCRYWTYKVMKRFPYSGTEFGKFCIDTGFYTN
jgi:hypothetical protein